MTSTLIGYFDNYEEAKSTEQDLLASGFAQDEVELVTQREQATQQRAEPSGFWENLKLLFGLNRDEDRLEYEEAARHGTIVAVRAPDDRVDLAATIIERHAPADIDRKMEEWGTRPAHELHAETEGETIPVVEEELRVGKQAVRRGAVRIHRFTTERPVEAEIPLREERIEVERHATDRPIAPGEDAFKERSIEVEAVGEEPIVSKEARVVEEVSIGKTATERTEKVRDEVRKTQVEVEGDDESMKRRK
jgi:uncharacterized protein (TIGR02271 family)